MRVAKMPYTWTVRGRSQVKVDVTVWLRPFFDGRPALTRFPKPGENVAEIIATFERPVETAQRKLDEH